MTHIDEWMVDPKNDPYARAMFIVFRLPAVEMLLVQRLLDGKKLFCMYAGERYRVTGASRFGDVWLAKNPNRKMGYEHRVDVDECSEWGPKR